MKQQRYLLQFPTILLFGTVSCQDGNYSGVVEGESDTKYDYDYNYNYNQREYDYDFRDYHEELLVRNDSCVDQGVPKMPGFWLEGAEETCLCNRYGSGMWEDCRANAPPPDPFLFHRTPDQSDDLEDFQKATDFVFDLVGSPPDPITTGGTVQPLSMDQLPALAGQGVSITLFNIEPCSVNLPHIHPRAKELLYLIQGSDLETTFIRDNGESSIQILQKGQATFFPQDLIHFQQNLGCEPAVFLSSLSSDDPGTIPASMFLNLQNINAILTTYDITLGELEELLENIPVSPALDPECVARCFQSNTDAPTPFNGNQNGNVTAAPTTTGTVSVDSEDFARSILNSLSEMIFFMVAQPLRLVMSMMGMKR